VIVVLLLPHFQLVRASFVLPLNIVKLTVNKQNADNCENCKCAVCCLSVCLYTNAPQVKLYVLKIHRVEVLTVTELRIQGFWDVMLCQWIFCLERSLCLHR